MNNNNRLYKSTWIIVFSLCLSLVSSLHAEELRLGIPSIDTDISKPDRSSVQVPRPNTAININSEAYRRQLAKSLRKQLNAPDYDGELTSGDIVSFSNSYCTLDDYYWVGDKSDHTYRVFLSEVIAVVSSDSAIKVSCIRNVNCIARKVRDYTGVTEKLNFVSKEAFYSVYSGTTLEAKKRLTALIESCQARKG